MKTPRTTKKLIERAKALKREVEALRRDVRKLTGTGTAEGRHAAGAVNTSENVRALRKSLRLSQYEMALLTGVSSQAVYLWERKGGPLRLRHLTRRALHHIRKSSPARIQKELRALENGSRAAKR